MRLKSMPSHSKTPSHVVFFVKLETLEASVSQLDAGEKHGEVLPRKVVKDWFTTEK